MPDAPQSPYPSSDFVLASLKTNERRALMFFLCLAGREGIDRETQRFLRGGPNFRRGHSEGIQQNQRKRLVQIKKNPMQGCKGWVVF